MKHTHMWVIVAAGLVLSFLLPPIGILVSPFVHLLFMTLMFFSTLNVSIRSVTSQIKHPGKIAAMLFLIHLASPLMLLPFRHLFSEELFLGLVLASTVPAGISSVFLSKMFGGDAGRSLVITTISSILSPITVPLLLLLFAHTSITIHPVGITFTIFKLIIVPLIIARIVDKTAWKKKIEAHTGSANYILLFLIIIGIISPVAGYVVAHLGTFFMLAAVVSLLNVILFLAGYHLDTSHEGKISYGVTASFKNFALSTVLALSLFNVEVALPAIVYSVINSFMLIPMQWFIEGHSMKKK